MNEYLDILQYYPIVNHNYSEWFQNIQYNSKILPIEEREKFIVMINETVAQYSEGLPSIRIEMERVKNFHSVRLLGVATDLQNANKAESGRI